MWSPDPSIIQTAAQRGAEAEAAAWASLRAERDRLIAATDWMVLRNLETSEPVPQAWLNYRQTLRDLPITTADPINPAWPEPPEAQG